MQEFDQVEADKVATYLRDEYLNREFFGKGQKSLGVLRSADRTYWTDARGFKRVQSVMFIVEGANPDLHVRYDYRPNERVRFAK